MIPGVAELDPIDRQLLRLLQNDALRSTAELGDEVGLSATPCWRRIQRLRAEGVIHKQVVLVDRKKVGLPLTAFVSLTVSQHDAAWMEAFQARVVNAPEVLEFYRVSGGCDYFLRLALPHIDAFVGLYKRLLRDANLSAVTSWFALEEYKATTAVTL